MHTIYRRLFCAAALGAALTAPAIATAADWPDRPITMIIMSQEGGGMDRASRLVGDALATRLGQPMKYVNRGGASGEIALKMFMKSKDDGYTLFSGNIPTLMMMYGQKQNDYVFDEKVAWLGGYLVDPALLVTPAESAFKTASEPSKKSPVRVGIANWASVQTLALLQLRDATGAQMEIIPYSGFKGASTALLGNHIEAGVGNFSATEKLGDGIRYLGIFADEVPDKDAGVAPLSIELGVELIDAASVRALAVHESLKTSHPDRYRKLNEAFRASISDPAFKASFKSIGAKPNQAVEWGEAEADKMGARILKQLETYRPMFEKKS